MNVRQSLGQSRMGKKKILPYAQKEPLRSKENGNRMLGTLKTYMELNITKRGMMIPMYNITRKQDKKQINI